MNKINLKKIVETKGMEPAELAKHLFPGHKHPKKALARVLADESHLDSMQISKLAMILDVQIQDLFEHNSWGKMKSKDGVLYMHSGDYTAELDTKTLKTKIFKNDTLFHEEILSKNSITLSEYVNNLNNLIKTL